VKKSTVAILIMCAVQTPGFPQIRNFSQEGGTAFQRQNWRKWIQRCVYCANVGYIDFSKAVIGRAVAMISLFDMMMNMQNGEAFRELSRQFRLSQKQTQAAIEALLPAFSQGLKRNAHDPYDAGRLMSAFASGQYSQFFDNPTEAFTPFGMQQGNDVLGQLFGSKDLSRAIAQQAAQATGIAQETFKQMLPALASLIMGGLHKQSIGQFGSTQPVGSVNPMMDFMQQMMRQSGVGDFANRPAQGEPAGVNPFDNPFVQAFQQMMRTGAMPAKDTSLANPFASFFEEMMKAASPPGPPHSEKPATNPSGRPRNPYDDIFGKMFESGREVRDQYQEGMEKIFDQYLAGIKKEQ
jgi:hypothetical protein